MKNIDNIFRKLGLTKNETDTLIALYAFKRATVTELANKSKIPRTTIYSALHKLEDKEAVMRVKVGKRELWEPVKPQRLLMNKQEQINKFKEIIPELEQLSSPSAIIEKALFEEYKGTRGLQRIYDMILDLGKGERVLGFEGSRSSERKVRLLPFEYSRDWHAKAKRKGIILEVAVSEKILDVIKKGLPAILEAAYGRATITHILPDEVMNFDSDIIVFRHHVAIITPKNKKALLITDHLISLAFRQLIRAACIMGNKIDLNAYIKQVQDKRG